MPNKTDLSTFNNAWYRPQIGASRLKQLVWYFINCLFFLNPLNPSMGLKKFLLRLFGARVGKEVWIKPAVNIKYPWKLHVGDYCWIGEGVWIDNLAPVTIGNHVCISQGAMLLTGNHNYKKSSFDLMIGEIVLEDGVWVGAKSLVGPGVTCRSHAVLSACSATYKNLEPYQIYSGNPAVAVRKREIDDQPL
ncbi:MAG: colanic acid biosynthesis acetyltransferase WcaF [Williamsia sp.]|nr:colanic acid biosynthesis acetyltransferase WcaF [Williamsia sp.]